MDRHLEEAMDGFLRARRVEMALDSFGDEHRQFYASKGLQTYNHGSNHLGAIDKTQSKLPLSEAHAHMTSHGYRLRKKVPDRIGGVDATHYVYEGKAPPYHTSHGSLTVKSNKPNHVWNAEHSVSRGSD